MTEAIHLASEDLRGSLRKDEDMRRHTSWRAGGHVERMYQPADLADLVLYLRNLPVDEPLLAVGLGSNLLVRDGGLRGTVLLLHAALSELRLEQDGTIYAQAGVPGAKLARFAANNNLRGAEFFAGIPGTVGGMLAMNAGCYGGETWNVVERVQTVDRAGILHERMPTEYEIGYRHVLKKDEGDNVAQSPEFFVGAWFSLEKGAGELSRKEIKALLNKRISSQPLNLPNAGSVFRNTQGDHAARLIEMSGLKGMKIGGAQVSEKHANFIVNLGSATAADIESLINEVREIVQHKTGIALHPEVRIVGDAKVNSVGVDNGREMNNISPNTKRQEFGKVAVMFGGRSAEREVSLKSGAAVLAALQRSGVDAHAFDPATQGLHTLQEQGFQRVFIALHGRYGEDGTVQGALELMDIPYTGSGVMASALAMDKFRSKLVWQAMNLPVPDYTLLTQSSDWNAVVQQLGLPLFVKPANEGSSVGISKVKSVDDLPAAYAEAAKHDSIVIAEQFIGGGEYTAAILGKQALPVIKIVPASEFYDYDAKYSRNDTRYLCPCDLPAEKEAEMQQLAQQAFAAIGGAGWGRVDFLMDEAGKLYLLEINTSPGMTDHSLVPMAARVAGLSFEQLVVQILEHAHVG